MYYRITSEDEAQLRENCTNIVKRHCRIGKVRRKLSQKEIDALSRAKPTGYYPYTGIPHVKGLGVIESLRHSF